MELTLFTEVSSVLAIAVVMSLIGLFFKQPLIISFLITGILVGPSGIGLIKGVHEIDLMASIGISLLLFVVGLRLDVGMIRTVGPVALVTGLGQIIFTSLIGFLIALFFGMPVILSLYVSVSLTFSSTIIIVKLLSDKKEIDSLHGRIAVGFLIVQDIIAIFALILLTAFGGDRQEEPLLVEGLWILSKGFVMLGAILVLMRWVLPRILHTIAHSQELLILFAITWAVFFSSTSELLGFSKEVGAFLAGVSIASTPQRDTIGSKLVVLRDFMLLFFFIHLGAQLDFSLLGAELGKATVFSLFVLIGNPLIVMVIMGLMGYRRRTGFMSGLAVAQISEFSLILAALGLSLGHIDASTMGLITLVGLLTIFASTYMILYSASLYSLLAGVLRIFERANPYRESQADAESLSIDEKMIIMMGLGNYGSAIARGLQEYGWHLAVVDFDPKVHEKGRDMGLSVIYGDVSDPEIFEQLPIAKASWVLCTIRDHVLALSLLRLLREKKFGGRIALAAAESRHVSEYRRRGAHIVLQPFNDAAEQAVETINGSIQSIPGLRDWPVVLEEASLQPGSVFTGKTLREIDIRSELGISVLAISRAGNTYFNPNPNFRMYPGDRIVLLCPPEQAPRAVGYLRQRELGTPQEQANAFDADEIHIPEDSSWVGQSLAELNFRKRFGVTVIGIRRGEVQLTSPRASDIVQSNDSIIVVGSPESVSAIKTAQDQ